MVLCLLGLLELRLVHLRFNQDRRELALGPLLRFAHKVIKLVRLELRQPDLLRLSLEIGSIKQDRQGQKNAGGRLIHALHKEVLIGRRTMKEIEVEVLAAATDTQTFTVTLSGAVGATLLLGAEDVTLTIDA